MKLKMKMEKRIVETVRTASGVPSLSDPRIPSYNTTRLPNPPPILLAILYVSEP